MNPLEVAVSQVQGHTAGSFNVHPDGILGFPMLFAPADALRAAYRALGKNLSPFQVNLDYFLRESTKVMTIDGFYGGPQAQPEAFQQAYDAFNLLSERKGVVRAETRIEDPRVESILAANDWEIFPLHGDQHAFKYFK